MLIEIKFYFWHTIPYEKGSTWV